MMYLAAHELSAPSERYVYILWILFACLALLLGIEHMLGLTQRSFLGAVWTKWATMHYVPKTRVGASVWYKWQQSMYKTAYVTLQAGNVLLLLLILVPVLCLTFIGADYINPRASIFDVHTNFPTPDEVRKAHSMPQRRGVQWGLGDYPRVLTRPPSYTLPYHTYWSMGSRFGDFCNALTPLVVLFALKQAPFALMALPLFGRYSMDALSFLHRWGGRLLWLYALIHTILWLVQVSQDAHVKPGLWSMLLGIGRFRWAITAFIFLTLLVVLSVGPIRRRYYEFFYVTHIVCVIGFMIATWLHHPQLGWWMLAAFLLWGLERLWRLGRVWYINGRPSSPQTLKPLTLSTMHTSPLPTDVPASFGKDDESMRWNESAEHVPMATPSWETLPTPFRPVISADLRLQLQPGYAFIQPLAGQMMRLVLRTTRPMSWRAGQWVYLMLPSLSWIQSHPFTIASSYVRKGKAFLPEDQDGRAPRDADQLIVLLIRARNGLTRRLWDSVAPSGDNAMPSLHASHVHGMHMRAIVDGPFGSAARMDWGAYSTCVIVCGGSGVTLGLAVLEHLCRKIANYLQGKSVHGAYGRSFLTRRVHFVWVMREYAHVQWAASTLRLCLEMLPPSHLRIELYVTRVHERPVAPAPPMPPVAPTLAVPASGENLRVSTPDVGAPAQQTAAMQTLGLNDNDLTQFGPDEDGPLTLADRSMNEFIRQEGKLRRERTRRKRSMRRPARARVAPMESFATQHANVQADKDLASMGIVPHANCMDEASGASTPQEALMPLDTSRPLPLTPIETSTDHAWPPPPTSTSATTKHDYFSLPSAMPSHESIPMEPLRPTPQQASTSTLHIPMTSATANLDPQEYQDYTIVSELTRAGYPPLDDIIRTEMTNAQGRTAVVGCGPSGLMALLRMAVSHHIELRKVWHGDASGHANLFTESYES